MRQHILIEAKHRILGSSFLARICVILLAARSSLCSCLEWNQQLELQQPLVIISLSLLCSSSQVSRISTMGPLGHLATQLAWVSESENSVDSLSAIQVLR